ncbi:MAG: aspartate aminotransferase family protein, partial [Candidatus Limnocylindrales bacterium]
MPAYRSLDRSRLDQLMDREIRQFRDDHPRSLALFQRASGSLLAGVPMNWMVKWAGGFPIFVESASGAHFSDVEGHEYIDFCLGDTGAMAGHGAPATVAAVERQIHGRGITHMLPTEDAVWCGEEL